MRGVLFRLIAAFAIATACFVASTLYAESVSDDIDDAAGTIAGQTIPSIVHLAEARGELRRLDLAATRYARSRGEMQRAEVLGARAAVEVELDRYLESPFRSAERRALWFKMKRSLVMVDRGVSELLGGAEAGGHDITRAVDAAAEAIRGAVIFHADRSAALAVEISGDRRRAFYVAWSLDLVSALMTAGAAYVAMRALVQHQLVLDERNRLVERRADELERFASRVAHDVLGPLSAIRLAVEATLPNVAEPDRRMLQRGQRGVERVVAIVDGLLRFARAGARPEPGAVTELDQVARSVIEDLEPFARDAGITLSLDPPPRTLVHGHAGVHASVLENLVRNAIKYMGDRPYRRIDIRLVTRDAAVRLEVEDTGPGVPSDLADTLWEPHVRGHDRGPSGLGLGLATVQRVVIAHGGRCGVRSRSGEGSVFWCELPRADIV